MILTIGELKKILEKNKTDDYEIVFISETINFEYKDHINAIKDKVLIIRLERT